MRYIVLLAAMLLMLSGCGSKSGQSTSEKGQAGDVKVQQTAPEQVQAMTSEQITDHLEQLAARLPNVESAHAVVFGNTAIVGINVNPKLDRAKVGTVKYSVAEALRKDPYGANAIVTADMDLDERLRHIRDEIKQGRAISGFADELGQIIGRVMPQLPRDVLPESNRPAPFQNDTGELKSDL